MIRRVFQLIIPFLALGPKSPLLDAIQGLLSTVAGSQDRNHSDGAEAGRTGVSINSPEDPQATPLRHGFSIGQGSRPFGALLPGMNSSEPANLEPQDTPAYQEIDDPATFFDFDSIDWDEFDRLTNELCR